MANWLTLQFGPWAPDLQNTPIPVGNVSETQIPCADVLNVYYQDGAYRCLPSLAPIASGAIGTVVSAFTYYDNVGAQDIVFIATANGIETLIDGVYTPVAFETDASVTGTGLALKSSLAGTITGAGLQLTSTLGSGTGVASSPLHASASPTTTSGFCTGTPSCTAITTSTVTASGGSGHYTYAWSYVSGTSFTMTGATTATAQWSATHNTASLPSFTGNYKCVVSDGTSNVTVNVTVDLTFTPT